MMKFIFMIFPRSVSVKPNLREATHDQKKRPRRAVFSYSIHRSGKNYYPCPPSGVFCVCAREERGFVAFGAACFTFLAGTDAEDAGGRTGLE